MRFSVATVAGSAAAVAVAVAGAGCGGNDGRTPVACLSGADAYLAALQEAPAEVRLTGRVPLGDCLPENQPGGELATVGTAMLSAATRLNARARARPGGSANLQVGYLLGSVEARADRTEGIHDELLRRLDAAALYSPAGRPLTRRFRRTYRRGQLAGSSAG